MNDWKYQSLDPINWNEIRNLGYEIIDDITDYLSLIDSKKVFNALKRKDYNNFSKNIPYDAEPLNECYKEFQENILKRHSTMNLHPGFLGWAMGCGNPVGFLAGIIEAGLNANVIGGMQISCLVEEQVLLWLKQLFGFPESSSGILTSGCSEANLIALAVARNKFNCDEIKKHGIFGYEKPLVFYTSIEVHTSIYKAIELLGIGRENLRIVRTNSEFEIDIFELEKIIEQDKKNGLIPTGIIANLGTINTGAIDDIEKLSEISKRENMWLHIDGAFGVFALLTEKFMHLKKVVALADSIAFDLHKWGNIQYNSGCVLINNSNLHLKCFSSEGNYIEHKEPWISDYGIALSRNFSAIKIWLSIKAYGVNMFSKCIQKNLNQAQYFYNKLLDRKEIEILSPVTLSVVTFRYKNNLSDEENIERINKTILSKLVMDGQVFPSSTRINGKYALRICIMNYRITNEVLDLLLDEVIRLGKELEIKQN